MLTSIIAVVVVFLSGYGLIAASSTFNGVDSSNKSEYSRMAGHSIACHVFVFVGAIGYLLYAHVSITF